MEIFMKKLVLVLVFLVILAAGAFAEHPGGWGIGVMGQSNFDWDGFANSWGAALSLKAPQLPIFWGINGRIRNDYFGLSVTGDYYIIDQTITPDINFGWYFGIGGYAGFYHVGENIDYNGLGFGARVPIGIYFIPVRFFEVFLDVAPSLGLGINFGNKSGMDLPAGGLGVDLGVRFWI
jgi:hypothetical protein